MQEGFFPLRPEAKPKIYAYEDSNPQYKGMLKVGFTTGSVEKRVAEQYPTKRPGAEPPWRIVFAEPAMRSDGSHFRDHAVHRVLKKSGSWHEEGECFSCTVDQLRAAYIAVCDGSEYVESRTLKFRMRPEQVTAVNKTYDYFNSIENEGKARIPKFLWNAKMRFGKTFAA